MEPPWWLGWLSIVIIPLSPVATLLLARWAYRFGTRSSPGGLVGYRWFLVRALLWSGLLLGTCLGLILQPRTVLIAFPLPVLYVFASFHLPTLCFKQGARVGIGSDLGSVREGSSRGEHQ
jgi:hypothetical protein